MKDRSVFYNFAMVLVVLGFVALMVGITKNNEWAWALLVFFLVPWMTGEDDKCTNPKD